MTKDQLLVHHINTLTKINVKIDKCELPTFYWLQNYTKFLINRVLYQIQVTALLQFFLSILHLLLQLSKILGSQVSSLDFSTLYTSLLYDLFKANVLSLVNWCFNRKSKTNLCTSLKAGCLATRNMTRIDVGLGRSCKAFTFHMGNIYVQFDGMVYQQIVGIPMGTNCALLIADLFFILL